MLSERLIRAGRAVKPFELSLLQLITVIVLISSGGSNLDTYPPPQIGFTETDNANNAQLRLAGSNWREMSLYNAPAPNGIAWVDWSIPQNAFTEDTPLAVSLQGPFSAEVFFNGKLIGKKGLPSEDAKSEIAGPIDANFAIPRELILENNNRLAMRYSANRSGYRPATVLQNLRLTPYRADPRRTLRYYAPAMIFSGALGAIAIGLSLLARERSDTRLYWLTLGVSGLIIAAIAEISRSLINYPYDWHQPRQAIVAIGFAGFAMGVLRFSTLRWPLSERAANLTFASGGVLIVLTWLIAVGYDAKIGFISLFIFLLSLGWLVWHGKSADKSAFIFAIPLSSFFFFVLFFPGDFIDRSVYALALALFGAALLRHRDLLSPKNQETTQDQVFRAQTGGQMSLIPVNDIFVLKAAGNYTEIHRDETPPLIDGRGLSAIERVLPENFMRVHRSHAINLSAIASLTTQAGSRYWITLKNGEKLPVSRARVSELRAAMKARATV